jgi:hypothetical protein
MANGQTSPATCTSLCQGDREFWVFSITSQDAARFECLEAGASVFVLDLLPDAALSDPVGVAWQHYGASFGFSVSDETVLAAGSSQQLCSLQPTRTGLPATTTPFW